MSFSGNKYGIGENSRTGIYVGIVEKIHPDFLKNGLLKARVSNYHYDTDIQYIPYMRVDQELLCWCNQWNEPKPNQNNVHLKVKGQSKIDGNLELKNMPAGGYLVAMATVSQAPSPFGLVGFGTPASGPNQTKGMSAVDGNGEFDLTNQSDYDTCEITPKQYDLRPWNSAREGKDLIRVGDEVLILSIQGSELDWLVLRIVKFGNG